MYVSVGSVRRKVDVKDIRIQFLVAGVHRQDYRENPKTQHTQTYKLSMGKQREGGAGKTSSKIGRGNDLDLYRMRIGAFERTTVRGARRFAVRRDE